MGSFVPNDPLGLVDTSFQDKGMCEQIADPTERGDCVDGMLHNEVGAMLFPFISAAAFFSLSLILFIVSALRRLITLIPRRTGR